MQTNQKTKQKTQGSRSQKTRILDMQAAKKQTQLNTSWNIRKLADLASLNSCSAKFNLKEAMHAYNSNLFTSMVNLMNLRK